MENVGIGWLLQQVRLFFCIGSFSLSNFDGAKTILLETCFRFVNQGQRVCSTERILMHPHAQNENLVCLPFVPTMDPNWLNK